MQFFKLRLKLIKLDEILIKIALDLVKEQSAGFLDDTKLFSGLFMRALLFNFADDLQHTLQRRYHFVIY